MWHPGGGHMADVISTEIAALPTEWGRRGEYSQLLEVSCSPYPLVQLLAQWPINPVQTTVYC